MNIDTKVRITISDEINCRFTGIYAEHMNFLCDRYALYVDGYQYMMLYQIGSWDGKIKFFYNTGNTFVYLMPEIIKSLRKLGYTNIDVVDNRQGEFHDVQPDVTEDYFSHITNPKTGSPYKLAAHQIEAANTMLSAGSGIALAGTGFGKAQPYGCKILTPTGWTTMGKIKKGDEVLTPKNTIAKVLSVHPQGVTDVYKITMNDGSITYANPEHLWFIYNHAFHRQQKATKYIKCTTLELKEKVKRYQKVYIPTFPVAIDLEKQNYEIDPYVYGSVAPFVWLKDDRVCIHITKKFKLGGYSIKFFKNHFAKYGIELEDVTKQICKLKYYGMVPVTEYGEKLINFTLANLKNEYRIPNEYIFGAAEDRLAFLQGLCDTTGKLSHGGTTNALIVHSLKLVEQISEMVIMQGGLLRKKYVLQSHRMVYALSISHKIPDLYFTSQEKKRKFLKYNHTIVNTAQQNLRGIRSVEYWGRERTKCILIDDIDHLYVTDGCIITHNTILNAVLVDKYKQHGCKTLTIVPATSLITQTIKQFSALQLNVSHFHSGNPSLDYDHILTTWQTLQNYPLLINQFQMVVVDECLSGETNITLANKTEKLLKDIKIGENIISYNVEKQIFEEDVVENVFENLLKSNDEKMYRLEFDTGAVIEVTGNHLFLTNDGYIRADKLTDDHEIINF